ncbi:helix-turn-helix transcriptional regulator [Clostridium baratii]
MNIGENIKKIRIKKGISRKKLAKELNVSEPTISRYENNKREPNLETLKKIANVLECDLSRLIGIIDWFDEIDEEIAKSDKIIGLMEKQLPLEVASLKSFDKDGIKELLTSTVADMLLLSINSTELPYTLDDFSTNELEEIGNFLSIAYDLKITEILNRHKSKDKNTNE